MLLKQFLQKSEKSVKQVMRLTFEQKNRLENVMGKVKLHLDFPLLASKEVPLRSTKNAHV